MPNLEGAAEGIDHLQAIIGRLNEEASRVDRPTGASEINKKVGPNGVPEEIASVASHTIQALLDTLATADRSVHKRVAGGPPEWWRNLQTILSDKRTEYTASHPALVNTFDILDGHIGKDAVALGGLPFLVDRLDQKLVRGGAGLGFRAPGGPNSNQISFSFDPQIDDEIDQSLRELLGEVFALPKECVAFLRQALDDARDVID